MPGKQLLMIVVDFGGDYGIRVPFQALQAVGHGVDAVRPDRSEGDTVRTAVHDFRGDRTYAESRGHDVRLTASLDEVDPSDYDGLDLCGVLRARIRRGGREQGVPRRRGHDANLVTRRDWGDHVEWIAEFLDVLGTAINHDEPAAAEAAED